MRVEIGTRIDHAFDSASHVCHGRFAFEIACRDVGESFAKLLYVAPTLVDALSETFQVLFEFEEPLLCCRIGEWTTLEDVAKLWRQPR